MTCHKDVDVMSFHNFYKNFLIFFFVILVPFEILLHYYNFECSHWLSEDINRIIDKVFRGKLMD